MPLNKTHRVYHLSPFLVVGFIYTIILLFFFSSCGRQDGGSSELQHVQTPLFIAMPENTGIFDNIGPSLYEAVHNRCASAGYTLVAAPEDGYRMALIIKRWEPVHKLVSPDVVLLHEQRILEVVCQVRNFADDVVYEKNHAFTLLISKPKNPILNTDFVHFELERLLVRAARDIEYAMRTFFMKKACS